MKFFKPKKLPNKIVRFFVMAYDWGYSDCKNGLPKKTEDKIKASLNKGYKRGISKGKA